LCRSVDAQWYEWNSVRGTRMNQDYQREVEDTALSEISTHIATLRNKINKTLPRRESKLKLVPTATVDKGKFDGLNGKQLSRMDSGMLAPPGGIFTQLEQDWRESHMAYLQHRSITSKISRPPSSGENLHKFYQK